MITSEQLAKIAGVSRRCINMKVNSGELISKQIFNSKNRKQNMFPISSLPDDIKEKYYLSKMEEEAKEGTRSLSYEERDEIRMWAEILKRWQEARNGSDMKLAEVDECFVGMMKIEMPELSISRRILYRKWKFYKEGKFEELIDKRGKANKNRTKVTREMLDAYIFYYMSENQPSMQKVYEYMTLYIEEEYPEQAVDIPSYKTMQRAMEKELPPKLRVLGRSGKKAYYDYCSYFIRREYDDLESNDYWIGDTHTIDVMTNDGSGKIHRLYFNAWLDLRSGIMTGWHITANPDSQATIYALRDGIKRRNSIPKNVYVDNGREYLTRDVGGLGHRQKKSTKNEFSPPPIFARLGIEMTNALVKNARAKVIERRFRDFKEHISKLFETYTGGNVLEKPESLKSKIKNPKDVVIDKEFKESLDLIIEEYFNREPYGGTVEKDRGKEKLAVYNEYLKTARRAPENELELMLMRSSKAMKVGQRGLTLRINGESLDYINHELHDLWGKEVYYRYDPDDLSYIRVYDLEDRYIMDVPCANETVLKYGAGKEDVKKAMKTTRSYTSRDVKALNAIKQMGLPTAYDLVLQKAMENKENPVERANPSIIELQRAVEKPLMAVNGNDNIDLDVMLKNIKEKNEEM